MTINVESSSNNIFKLIKSLNSTNGRKKHRKYIVEGVRSVRDAMVYNAPISFIVVSESYNGEYFWQDTGTLKTYVFSDKLFNELKLTVNSQGIIAVVSYNENTMQEFAEKQYEKIVYLDGVQDPGNLGTILRTCDAMGIDALVLGVGCVDLYNPKVVRSTMASIFNVPVYTDDDVEQTFDYLKYNKYKIIGTFLNASEYCNKTDLTGKCVLIMGNEGNGISRRVENMCTARVKIPMSGGAESLNVSVACGMILYERFLQNENAIFL